jgi:predicted Fe-Mo cluster-binding NifX family protein
MIRIAIPEHQGRIAPVFDTCQRILVFAQQGDGEAVVAREDWSAFSRQGRAVRLKELGVEVLLCGGISCGIEDQIHLNGIRLVSWLAGDVPAILTAFRKGKIMNPEYAMPGTLLCRQRRQMRRRRNHRSQSGSVKAKEK